MNSMITVGIADMKITRAPGVLITYALGSCIGICVYDPVLHLAGMIHIMLPEIAGFTNGRENIFKYADSGIPEMLRKMEVFGASKRRMTAKIAGGAKMFDIPGTGGLGNIGERNAESVKATLRREGIHLLNQDIGSNYARTLVFDASTGETKIRAYGHGEVAF